jgi:ADP-ribosylglycohydrolase
LGTGGHGTIGKPINNSKGCGGVMRVAPIGLVKQFAPQEAFRLAAEVAALTHGHTSGYLSAGMMAGILRCVMDVKDIHGAIESSLAILATYPGHPVRSTLRSGRRINRGVKPVRSTRVGNRGGLSRIQTARRDVSLA